MAHSPVIFFGSSNSGKTSLIHSLTFPKFSNQYRPTLGIDIHSIEVRRQQSDPIIKTATIGITEIGGSYLNEALHDEPLKKIWMHARVAVYCVDINEPLTQVRLEQIKKDISSFRVISPEVPLIIAGTKTELFIEDKLNDYAVANRILAFLQKMDETRNCRACLVSAKHGSAGTCELLNLLPIQVIGEPVHEATLIFRKILTKIPERSELFKAIKKLQDLTEELASNKKIAIANYTDTLLNKVKLNNTKNKELIKTGLGNQKVLSENI